MKNYSLAVIGAGKLAWSFVPALSEAGYNIISVISRDYSDAEELARSFNIPHYSDSVSDVPEDCEIIFLSVPDDQLNNIARQLSQSANSGKMYIHFSGVFSSDIIKDISSNAGLTASFHILQTFPSKKRINIKNSYAAIETGFKKAEEILYELAAELQLNAFIIPADKKTEYHLAAVFASNFLVANMHTASELFKLTGSETDFNKCIAPIVEHTLSNIFSNGAVNALSGPVERGDLHTIKKHVDSLINNKNLLRNYVVQSLSIVNIKKKQGKEIPALEEIEIYLLNQLKNNS
jgi:predicted short-subunit dehydrogenase-like oxidoreductase (DUF2520 family)